MFLLLVEATGFLTGIFVVMAGSAKKVCSVAIVIAPGFIIVSIGKSSYVTPM
jgi:hypothetical protein